MKNRHDSRISVGAPVQTVIGMDGKNILTAAVADVKTPMQIGTGISEHTAALCCDITFFTLPMAPFDRYETTLRIDTRSIAYEQAVKAVGTWWEGFYDKADVPEIARLPVYSTWYSFHQAFTPDEIEAQCRMAKDMGMQSIIVDDGWQTEDSSLGYAYCGDWEPAEGKVGDIRVFSDMVHKTGMKLIVWFSVPFVGEHSSLWKRFEGMTLHTCAKGYDCLDPRYKEVRQYLAVLKICAIPSRHAPARL